LRNGDCESDSAALPFAQVRIIAGEFRGRQLLAPESDTTRPITDRVKQSLFDIIAPLIPDSIIYDCFAGTGSMGLESLSRGAAGAVFFERDRSAVKRLKENIQSLKVEDRSTVVSDDIFRWFGSASTQVATAGRAAVVFLDPPYRFLTSNADELRLLAHQLRSGHLRDDGIIIFRHDARDRLELPDLARYDEREYGGMTLEFLRRSNA
jgi:16S rRNA (guanine966-N2)-methyltransferase